MPISGVETAAAPATLPVRRPSPARPPRLPRPRSPVRALAPGLSPKPACADWWAQELENVVTARIDVLNLIGGEVVRRSQYDRFAVMLQVMRQRAAAGKPNPKVAMFYDGMGFGRFRRANLDEEAGMAEFYKWLKTFYDFFITQQNARDVLYEFEGGFPVFIYHPEPDCGVTCVQDKLVPYVKEHFARDFPGLKVYLIFSELYRNGFYTDNKLHLTNADNYFNWGASYGGIASPDAGRGWSITTIGPGFDDRNRTDQRHEGWGERIRDRKDGALFRQEFARATRVRDRAPWLVLETWNLFLEGSQIAVTRLYGDKYVQICRELIPPFKQPMTPAEAAARDVFRPDGQVTILGPADAPDALLNENHFVCDWWVLGAFDLPKDLRTDEGAPSLGVRDGPRRGGFAPRPGRRWRASRGSFYRNPHELVPEVVDLRSIFGEPDYTVAYLAAEVIAPQAGPYRLLVGSDDYVKVYVNGQAVHSFDKAARGAVQDTDVVPNVTLRQGSNWLVLKVLNLRGSWGAVARFATADGQPLTIKR